MRRIYSIYAIGMSLILGLGLLLADPPTKVCAANCSADCQYGSSIFVSGASCSCTDNVGGTWTNNQGQSFTQKCASKNDEFETEAPPAN